MADPKDPHSDEHIEDLLSQLQGIFGKISQSEDEDPQQKRELPPKAPPPKVPPAPAPIMEPSPTDAPPLPVATPPVENIPEETPLPPPPIFTPPEEAPLDVVPLVTPQEPEPAPAPAPAPVEEPAPPPAAPIEFAAGDAPPDDDGHTVPTVIYYPLGREADAKVLAQKLETMAPKFTKVAFQLRVATAVPYDSKGDARETLLSQNIRPNVRAVFFIVERPLDDLRKKSIAGQLEPRGVYFQEVPLVSIEKKAFYTDLLLGLVFFFDSLKSKNGSNGSTGG